MVSIKRILWFPKRKVATVAKRRAVISHGNSARPAILFFNQVTKQRDEGDNITGEEIKRSIRTFCLFVAKKESDRANIESSRRGEIFEIRRVGPSND